MGTHKTPGKHFEEGSAAELPTVPLRDTVLFPHMFAPLMIGRQKSLEAMRQAENGDSLLFLVTQKAMETEDPGAEDVFDVGVVGRVVQALALPDGSQKALIEVLSRGRIQKFVENDEVIHCVAVPCTDHIEPNRSQQALMRSVGEQFESYVKLNPAIPDAVSSVVKGISEYGKFADSVCAYVVLPIEKKQEFLAEFDPVKRLERVNAALVSEIKVLELKKDIDEKVRERASNMQRDFYLREQKKVIESQLGEKTGGLDPVSQLREKVENAELTEEARKVANRELERLAQTPAESPQATVSLNYLDWIISLPWKTRTEDHDDLRAAGRMLDKGHYGLAEPKERIIEYLAVLQMVKRQKGPILCFAGPPGVGKTSLARGVAQALGRNFVKVSLGGVRDEAEIRGHRRTYVGALPGRIIQGLRKAASRNPVFLLDEIDKLGADFRGDPTSALLEVLDPDENSHFSDHYLELEFDLSEVLFITTCNMEAAIPAVLLDRTEVIRLPGYTEEEKRQIAKRHLIPRNLSEHGLTRKQLTITDPALRELIREYTSEAGVRNLDKHIAALCRKCARRIVEKRGRALRITPRNIVRYLGLPDYRQLAVEEGKVLGTATGLAWTEHGGRVMTVEASAMPGKGELYLTGKLGEVMKESAAAAVAYIRSHAAKLGLDPEFFAERDLHVHVPEGAVPKDGPSAGAAMAVAMLSALTGRKVDRRIGITGEVTLRGRILPVGGIKAKVLAAHREKVNHLVVPRANERDVKKEIPDSVAKTMQFTFADRLGQVFSAAMEPPAKEQKDNHKKPGKANNSHGGEPAARS
jgi:ATP-dependent Lon protease